jgi:adenine-specific DNA-methyltransferase
LDEVFGPINFCAVIPFRTAISQPSLVANPVCDYLLRYARDLARTKSRRLFQQKRPGDDGASIYTLVEEADGLRRRMTQEEIFDPASLPEGS